MHARGRPLPFLVTAILLFTAPGAHAAESPPAKAGPATAAKGAPAAAAKPAEQRKAPEPAHAPPPAKSLQPAKAADAKASGPAKAAEVSKTLADQAPAPASASFPADGAKLLLGSLLLAGLLFAAARVVRRLPIGRLLPGADGPIRVVARTHLGAKERLCLVEVGPTSLLLALTPQGIHTLHAWPQGITPAPHGAAQATASDHRTGAEPARIPGQLRSLAARLTGGQ